MALAGRGSSPLTLQPGAAAQTGMAGVCGIVMPTSWAPGRHSYPEQDEIGAHAMPSSVPVIDLTPWFGADEAARAAVAGEFGWGAHPPGVRD
jgi:hypothetical protein